VSPIEGVVTVEARKTKHTYSEWFGFYRDVQGFDEPEAEAYAWKRVYEQENRKLLDDRGYDDAA
jgi:hypothetical protein